MLSHHLAKSAKEVLKFAIATARRPSGQRRLARELSEADPAVKLHVGAGRHHLAGWINTDVTWRSSRYLDLSRAWPLGPSSVHYVYADNVVEHLPLVVTRLFLREARRALVPGGRIRLVTPDVEGAVNLYLANDADTAFALGRYKAKGMCAEYPVDVLRVVFAEHGHHEGYCFDARALAAEMEAAGLQDVVRHEIGRSDHHELTGLESRTDREYQLTTLVLEATCR